MSVDPSRPFLPGSNREGAVEHIRIDGSIQPLTQIGRPTGAVAGESQGLRAHQQLDAMQAARDALRLSGYSQQDLNAVALQLNTRPRKTLGFTTPAAKLAATVALTA